MSIDERVQAAYNRLVAGRPELSDGRLTVTNVCLEAAVSRASFYRCGGADKIRQALSDLGSMPQPQAEEAHAQVRALRLAETALRSLHATEVRQLRVTVATYAKQIQLLALRAAQLEADTQHRAHRVHSGGDNITPLSAPH